jgi:hypothetical protein
MSIIMLAVIISSLYKKIMIKNITLIITLISLNSCVTNNIISPIAGTWEADFDGCIETWIIDNKGNRVSISGEEQTNNKFIIQKLEENVYKITDTRLSTNSKPDCSGETVDVPIGNVTNGIIKFQGNNRFTLCNTGKCLEKSPFIRKK